MTEELDTVRNSESPVQVADMVVRKLKRATEWAQSAMAVAQQTQEELAYRSRTEGPAFQVGDNVWLIYVRNLQTDRTS